MAGYDGRRGELAAEARMKSQAIITLAVLAGCLGAASSASGAKESANVTDQLYSEKLRPQFHFSAKAGWINDPNGLVFYKGVWHMFFQYNPFTPPAPFWGHAISKDLVHWKQIEHAILPDAMGTIFSGSAVVDWKNTSGFKKGDDAPLVAFYTAAGGTSDESKGAPFTQCSAYSTDAGMTWTKYEKNPVIPHIKGANRDPKAVWHEPGQKWVLILYIDEDWFALFESKDTKIWTKLQDFQFPGHTECPDFFPMKVEGEPGVTKWVLTTAIGDAHIGSFDGKRFVSEAGPLTGDFGANYYAVQTFSDAPGGRRIQVAWMRGAEYPDMPFTQQMNFPTEMTLRRFPEGLRICRQPVREIEKLHDKEHSFKNKAINPGENLLAGISGGLLHIQAEIEPGKASAFGFRALGEEVRWSADGNTLSCLGKTAIAAPENGRIRLEILVDRTSIEVFANGGRAVMSSCFVPKTDSSQLECFAEGGAAKAVSLKVHTLKSAWR